MLIYIEKVMVKKKTNKSKRKYRKPNFKLLHPFSYKSIVIGKRTVHYVSDRVVIFRLMRRIHGRFWGVSGIIIMTMFFTVCFMIRPDMLNVKTALSDFGRDVRTAPYLAAALFFGAYGLWRWRNYLKRTLKHSRPVTTLVFFSVVGLYIAALFPVAWEPVGYRIHIFGVMLFGISMAMTVLVDTSLSKTKKKKGYKLWRVFRLFSFMLIISGGYITLGSITILGWFELALLGEVMMFLGYSIWIVDKTYRGEGARSQLSKLFKGMVLID